MLEQDTQGQEMGIDFLLALLLVYLVMASLFESLAQPFAILFSIPFALPGAAWLLAATDTPFNLMSQIGLLILMGIVVNNGIVLLDHMNQLRNAGMATEEAILQAGRDRMRAILMTASTTIIGLALRSGVRTSARSCSTLRSGVVGKVWGPKTSPESRLTAHSSSTRRRRDRLNLCWKLTYADRPLLRTSPPLARPRTSSALRRWERRPRPAGFAMLRRWHVSSTRRECASPASTTCWARSSVCRASCR